MDKNYKPNPENLVEVNDLKMYFPIKTGMFSTTPLKAVDGVSFSIKPGETLGLVGESGCGKTTVGRALIRLYKPTDGDVFFDGKRVDEKSIGTLRKDMQMVFQDPYSSLNPRMTVEDIIGEPLDVHKLYSSRAERRDRILELMSLVGLNAEHATRYAHEFSGGQRQALTLLMAVMSKPSLLLLDEHTAALDPTNAAIVMELTRRFAKEYNLTVMMVTHNMQHALDYGNRLIMMNKGQIISDISGEEKKQLTMDSIVELFKKIKVNNDNVMLN